jgi:hypothetical protein
MVGDLSMDFSKTMQGKSGLSNDLCHVCQRSKTVNHIFWECQFTKQCCMFLEDQCS